MVDFWDSFDIADDLMIIAGVALALLTPYADIGFILALAGLGLMWAKGEIG